MVVILGFGTVYRPGNGAAIDWAPLGGTLVFNPLLEVDLVAIGLVTCFVGVALLVGATGTALG